ncbi:hypothetical protein HDU98_007809 [Podochytrium sp. JEL0797]|nr:hypothetical protein HDU98_007809 [Podochytrium sp. JEL0797]
MKAAVASPRIESSDLEFKKIPPRHLVPNTASVATPSNEHEQSQSTAQVSSNQDLKSSEKHIQNDLSENEPEKASDPPSNFFSDAATYWLLIPAYDCKGRPVRLDQFDRADFEEMNFEVTGLHPKSRFLCGFDFFMAVVHVACLITVPVMIGFKNDLNPLVFYGFQIIMTVLYLVDSAIALATPQSEVANTAIYSIREYEATRPELSIPFDLFFTHPNTIFLILLRIARVSRLPSITRRSPLFTRFKIFLEAQLGVGASKVVPIAVAIFFYIHYNACMIYYAGQLTGFAGWTEYWVNSPTDVPRLYLMSFCVAVGNMFPMGFKPQSTLEQLSAIGFVFVGAGLYAVLVGYISSAAMSIDISGRAYNQKMEELIDYIKWRKLNEETRQKLVSYYETKYRGKYFEEDALLGDMNESLRTEISLCNTRELITKVQFLRREADDNRDEIFYARIASALHIRYFIPGDCVTKQGESGTDMFFILSGKVDVYCDGIHRVSLYDGSYFGEVALLTKVLRTATVQAKMPSVLYRLTHHDFHAIITQFQKVAHLALLVKKSQDNLEHPIHHGLTSHDKLLAATEAIIAAKHISELNGHHDAGVSVAAQAFSRLTGKVHDHVDFIPQFLHGPLISCAAYGDILKQQVDAIKPMLDGIVHWESLQNSLYITTAFFASWLVGYLDLGIGWVFVLMFFVNGAYRRNMAKVKGKIEVEMARMIGLKKLETDTETVEWFNRFLDRFWIQFEPALSQTLKDTIDPVLASSKPAFLDDLSLSVFTLGSVAPRIETIRTTLQTSNDTLLMEWDLRFVPVDESGVSKREKELGNVRHSKIEVVAKLGKGPVAIPIPVVVAEIEFRAKLRLELKFVSKHPHVSRIDYAFVETPIVDFTLRPLKALDMMDMPGLKSSLNQILASGLSGFVSPNKNTIDLDAMLNGTITDFPVGVLKVTLHEAKNLKNIELAGTSDPYVAIRLGGKVVAKSSVKDNK